MPSGACAWPCARSWLSCQKLGRPLASGPVACSAGGLRRAWYTRPVPPLAAAAAEGCLSLPAGCALLVNGLGGPSGVLLPHRRPTGRAWPYEVLHSAPLRLLSCSWSPWLMHGGPGRPSRPGRRWAGLARALLLALPLWVRLCWQVAPLSRQAPLRARCGRRNLRAGSSRVDTLAPLWLICALHLASQISLSPIAHAEQSSHSMLLACLETYSRRQAVCVPLQACQEHALMMAAFASLGRYRAAQAASAAGQVRLLAALPCPEQPAEDQSPAEARHRGAAACSSQGQGQGQPQQPQQQARPPASPRHLHRQLCPQPAAQPGLRHTTNQAEAGLCCRGRSGATACHQQTRSGTGCARTPRRRRPPAPAARRASRPSWAGGRPLRPASSC